jgi:hypothetical protein
MELQVGDKFSDESGEWEVIACSYATVGGKGTNVPVQRVDNPGVTEARLWDSYEKVSRRYGARPPKRASDDASIRCSVRAVN